MVENSVVTHEDVQEQDTGSGPEFRKKKEKNRKSNKRKLKKSAVNWCKEITRTPTAQRKMLSLEPNHRRFITTPDSTSKRTPD